MDLGFSWRRHFLSDAVQALIFVRGGGPPNQDPAVPLDPGMRQEFALLSLCDADVELGPVVAAAEQKVLEHEGLRQARAVWQESMTHRICRPGGTAPIRWRSRPESREACAMRRIAWP